MLLVQEVEHVTVLTLAVVHQDIKELIVLILSASARDQTLLELAVTMVHVLVWISVSAIHSIQERTVQLQHATQLHQTTHQCVLEMVSVSPMILVHAIMVMPEAIARRLLAMACIQMMNVFVEEVDTVLVLMSVSVSTELMEIIANMITAK